MASKKVFLITAYQAVDKRPLSLQLDDRWFDMQSMEPIEVESEFDANKLIEIYGPVYGIVEVQTVTTRTGVSFAIEAAEEAAVAELNRIEKLMVETYVRDQRENRIRHNYPALPPTGRVAEIVAGRHIDLKAKYNLDILGMEPVVDPEKAQLQQENKMLRNRLDAQDAKMDQLLELATAGADKGKKG